MVLERHLKAGAQVGLLEAAEVQRVVFAAGADVLPRRDRWSKKGLRELRGGRMKVGGGGRNHGYHLT
jgi:hypothetical protein